MKGSVRKSNTTCTAIMPIGRPSAQTLRCACSVLRSCAPVKSSASPKISHWQPVSVSFVAARLYSGKLSAKQLRSLPPASYTSRSLVRRARASTV
jgi:hypothetical protein